MTQLALATPTQARLAREHAERRRRLSPSAPRDVKPVVPVVEIVTKAAVAAVEAGIGALPQEALLDTVSEYPEAFRVKLIQRAVAREFDIGVPELLSRRRMAKIVFPRQIAIFIAKDLTVFSLPELGRRFGDLDHTTVLHAIRKIDLLVRKDAKFANKIGQIKTQILAVMAEAQTRKSPGHSSSKASQREGE